MARSGHSLWVKDTVLYIWGTVGVYNGRGCRLLVAMDCYDLLIYDDVSWIGDPKEVPEVGS